MISFGQGLGCRGHVPPTMDTLLALLSLASPRVTLQTVELWCALSGQSSSADHVVRSSPLTWPLSNAQFVAARGVSLCGTLAAQSSDAWPLGTSSQRGASQDAWQVGAARLALPDEVSCDMRVNYRIALSLLYADSKEAYHGRYGQFLVCRHVC